ncbi:MAG: DUF4143 domain-containing protein [Treponema sp.]|nr:DUF4143 domain-containing protein [Treponema sp.]
MKRGGTRRREYRIRTNRLPGTFLLLWSIFQNSWADEILKSYWHNGDIPNIYFYRDTNGREIDFLIEQDMTLYPIEVKKTAMPRKDDAKHFKALEQFGKPIGPGAIPCLCSHSLPLADLNALSVPVWEI